MADPKTQKKRRLPMQVTAKTTASIVVSVYAGNT
jgi:hypothetical protein